MFAATHQLLDALIRDGRVTGVRIDHPDGLFDPARYFEMLQDLAADAWGIGCATHGDRARSTSSPRRFCPAREQLPRALGGARHDRLQLPQQI